jgi:antiviral helicase SKI2
LGFKEVRLKDAGTTAKNSTSLRRKPGPPDESTRGCSNNYPFWPGGFDLEEPEFTPETSESLNSDDPSTYLTCPPGNNKLNICKKKFFVH